MVTFLFSQGFHPIFGGVSLIFLYGSVPEFLSLSVCDFDFF